MSTLANHQFEILPSEDAEDGVVFGIGARISVNGDDGFDPGEDAYESSDGVNGLSGTRAFGRDLPTAKTWTWNAHVNETSVSTARGALSLLARSWRNREVYTNSGAVTALRYRMAGENRRVFGRPRRFAAPPSNQILSGYVPVTMTFDLVDTLHYDDIEQNASIAYSSTSSGGGFVFPTSFPLASSPSTSSGTGQIEVGGDEITYPIIRFNGPWTNPSITNGTWTLAWNGGIPAGGWIEIDCRPWKQTVLNQSGGSAVEGLPRSTFLDDIYLEPGDRPGISLGGSAPSGGASVDIRWRNAYVSY